MRSKSRSPRSSSGGCGRGSRGGYLGHVSALIAAATIPNLASALVGAAVVVRVFPQAYLTAFMTWWASDGLGMLFLAPLVVELMRSDAALSPAPPRRIESGVFLGAWCLGAWAVFHVGEVFVALPYTMLALLTWASLRFGIRTVVTALGVLAVVSASSPLVGLGPSPLGGEAVWDRVVRMQMYLGVTGAMGLLLAAARYDVQRALEAAREGKRRLESLADRLPGGVVFQLAADGDPPPVLFVSGGVQSLAGVSVEDVMADANRLWSCVDDADRSTLLPLTSGPHRPGTVYRGEVRLHPVAGGVTRHVMISAALRDVPGGLRAWDGIIVDVTEQRSAAEALRVTEERMQRAEQLELVGQLAGGVAHDFNNLLTVILGEAECLRLQAPTSQLREQARSIEETALRAGQLTQQLLAAGRRLIMARVDCDLNAVVARTDRLLRTTVGESIAVRHDLAASPLPILADPVHLERLLLNLALNARDAMPRGGVLTISTRARPLPAGLVGQHGTPGGRHACLTVRDTGVGIPPEMIDRVFEPFFTTKPDGAGVGLGLAAVSGIVRQSDGHLEVTSVVGEGTAFSVFLPLREAAPAPADTEPEAPPSGGVGLVLLVEDDDGVRALAERVLTRAGYAVVSASGGREALARVADRPPIDILLTDVMMPEMSGPDLARSLAALYPGLPTLFMSGYSNDAVLSRGVAAGEIPFLRKPFTGAQLLAKVRETLGPTSVQ